MSKKPVAVVEPEEIEMDDDLDSLFSDDEDDSDLIESDEDAESSEISENSDDDDLEEEVEAATEDVVEAPAVENEVAEEINEIDLDDLTDTDLKEVSLSDLGDTKSVSPDPTPAKKRPARKVKSEIVKELPVKRAASLIDFDPDRDAADICAMTTALARSFVDCTYRIGKIIQNAKLFFKKDKESYVSWLEDKAGLAYSTSQFYVNLSKVFDDENLRNRAVQLGWNSAHMKEIIGLAKKPELIEEIMSNDTVEIESTGETVSMKELNPKQLKEVVKATKAEHGVEDAKPEIPPDPVESFLKFAKKVSSFVDNNWDDIRDYSKSVPFKMKDLSAEQTEQVSTFTSDMERFKKHLDAILKKVTK